ncbi:hypothetical protein ACHAWF_001625, partial [Thalassiosira exigua]
GKNNRYHGGTNFNNAVTDIIWAESQVSINAGNTLLSKARFEQWLIENGCVEIKHLNNDNGVFSVEEFKDECAEKNQTQSFSGVGAQYRNAKAERAMQTIMWMARIFLVTGMTPMELLTKNRAGRRDLIQTHIWGCPTYVLDLTLQGEKKFPKFNQRSRQTQFLGFSDQHSWLVAYMQNLNTGFVSPQYHFILTPNLRPSTVIVLRMK